MMQFIIPLPPITKKNSQQILRNSKTGKSFIAPSKQYQQYEAAASWYVKPVREPISTPCNIQALFYMPTNRRVDLVNLQEALLDVLVHCGVIADDNSAVVSSMDGSRVLYDKGNPRTEITIEKLENTMKKPEINSDAYIVRTYTGVKHIKRGRISEIRTTPDGDISVTVFGIGRGIWGDRVFDTFDGAAARLED